MEKREVEVIEMSEDGPGLWYLSFAATGKFLGVYVTKAQSIADAIKRAGEVPGVESIAAQAVISGVFPENRLIGLEEIRRLGSRTIREQLTGVDEPNWQRFAGEAQ